MYQEEEYLMLSALQHLLYCERQCFLIHSEQQWSDNYFTASGNIMHGKVDCMSRENVGNDLRLERGLLLKSAELGLSGKADVVEFHRCLDGHWIPFPVEYKHGKPKQGSSDRIQLCAQALCLEEMLHCSIPAGALFYGRTRRRLPVDFCQELRDETLAACKRLHKLLPYGKPPPAVYEPRKCQACSLKEMCLPGIAASQTQVDAYLDAILEEP